MGYWTNTVKQVSNTDAADFGRFYISSIERDFNTDELSDVDEPSVSAGMTFATRQEAEAFGLSHGLRVHHGYDGRHGGPHDRGSADAYYCRGPRPHYYAKSNVRITDLTTEELEAYNHGYDNETDRKDFGH